MSRFVGHDSEVHATESIRFITQGYGCPSEEELDAVRRRREFPVKMTQRMQAVVQNHIISGALKGGDAPVKAPLILRVITAVPWLQAIAARFVAVGVRPEHVHSPVARAS
jgi:hypothetical protein